MADIELLHANVIRVRVFWGYSIRTYPASATQASLPIPPPTSVVGAVAHAYGTVESIHKEYCSLNGDILSFAAQFVEDFGVKYAGVCLLDKMAVPTLQTIRFFTMPVRAPRITIEEFARHRKVAEMFAPVQLGYMAYPGGQLTLILLSEKQVPYNVLWSLSRIGSKESAVEVLMTRSVKVSLHEVQRGELLHKVNVCFLAELGKTVPPSDYELVNIPISLTLNEWRNWYSFKLKPGRDIIRPAVVPLPEGYVTLRVTKRCYEVTISDEGGSLRGELRYKLLVPPEVIEG